MRRLVHDAVTTVVKDESLGIPSSLGLARGHAAVKHPMSGRQELRGFQNHLYYVFVDHPLCGLSRIAVDIEDIDGTSPK
jgi:hypothetical protein